MTILASQFFTNTNLTTIQTQVNSFLTSNNITPNKLRKIEHTSVVRLNVINYSVMIVYVP